MHKTYPALIKSLFILAVLCSLSLHGFAQTQISDKDLNNLMEINKVYNLDVSEKNGLVFKILDSLRTPFLNHMVDVMILIARADSTVLQKKYVERPSHDELMCWYVLREFHNKKSKKQDLNIAREILAKKIDERWLVDNYYYAIVSGTAMLLNDKDLSAYNFEIDAMGFKDDTEKAIFYFNMVDGFINTRVSMLQFLNQNDKILNATRRVPTFNGKAYFNYSGFDFEDFEWTRETKKQSFKRYNINKLINTTMAQFVAYASTGDKASAKTLYFNSIVHNPDFFKYSEHPQDLQQVYDMMIKAK